MAERRDVFLNAGDFYFSRHDESCRGVLMRTLLGSCVSVLLWNPEHRIGGMCHAVLPEPSPGSNPYDGNHCSGAISLFQREIQRAATPASGYMAYLAGGARMSMGMRNPTRVSVGERNVERCRALLNESGIALWGEHVGLSGPRRVSFAVESGDVEVVHQGRAVTIRLGG
jgi:chemotaxis protein CheD